ncbi:MAG TPA: hypothetical protein VMW53_08675 [archaeon]|nr:hypothetical protein [archaeon]
MRVVYLFVSKGGAAYNSKPDWNPKAECSPNHTEPLGLETEGTFYILDKLQAEGVIDELFIVMESARGPGKAVWGRHRGVVVPELSQLSEFIRPNDVLLVRGGWRGWWEWLNDRAGTHWLLNYSANTGRQRWKFWDIILWDLDDVCFMDRLNRLWITFRKPTHPGIFKNLNLQNKYDICIGASFIHTKKGQWRMIHILDEYRKRYKSLPRCIMPGALRSSAGTPRILNRYEDLGIELPGMLPRHELAEVLNQSSIGVFLSTSGQNDRGPLEAMQCGCKLVLGSPKYHSPVTYANSKVTFVPEDIDDYKSIAIQLHKMIENYNPKNRHDVLKWNEKNAHADFVTFPMLERMFDMIRANPVPDPEAMRREYGL